MSFEVWGNFIAGENTKVTGGQFAIPFILLRSKLVRNCKESEEIHGELS
jgi:hypothetical protein